jgi:hypothetical protein
VLRIPRQRPFAQDDEPIDGDAELHDLVAHLANVASGIVGAVAGHIDGPAFGFEWSARKLRHRELDAAA